MLEGFGLAPVTLDLYLDSYEGPWTHVERFRGRSGWLLVAEATIHTPTVEATFNIVAACDDREMPIPAFMRPNLLACACSIPKPCDEYPPDVLDEILCEEEGELIRNFYRENSTSLAELFERTAAQIERLEATTRRFVEIGERQIADLRRRRRTPGASLSEREALNALIAAIEDENDAAVDAMLKRTHSIRTASAAMEEALIAGDDLVLEVEPAYYVRWTGRGAPRGQQISRRQIPPVQFTAGCGAPAPDEDTGKPIGSFDPMAPSNEDKRTRLLRQLEAARRAVEEAKSSSAQWQSPHGRAQSNRLRAAEEKVRYLISRLSDERVAVSQVQSPGDDSPGRGWTKQRVALMTRMWLDGNSASRIASELGGVSRNAVIGKAERLGLPFRTAEAGQRPQDNR